MLRTPAAHDVAHQRSLALRHGAAKAQPVRGQAVALVAGSEGGTDDGGNCCDQNIMIFNMIQHW